MPVMCQWQCCKSIRVDVMILQGFERLGHEHGSLLVHVRMHLLAEIFIYFSSVHEQGLCPSSILRYGLRLDATSPPRVLWDGLSTGQIFSKVHLGHCRMILEVPMPPHCPGPNSCTSPHPVRACKCFPKPNFKLKQVVSWRCSTQLTYMFCKCRGGSLLMTGIVASSCHPRR